MKKFSFILCLFLVSLLFISSCYDSNVFRKNDVAEFCVGEGESIAITHPDYAEDCCEGLVQISNKDPDFSGAGICTGNCGDGICNEDSESSYNCEIDCELNDSRNTSDDVFNDFDQDASEEEVESNTEGPRWEDVYEDTQCNGDDAIAIIFELVQQSATNEQIMEAMCDINCEELNPQDYICS